MEYCGSDNNKSGSGAERCGGINKVMQIDGEGKYWTAIKKLQIPIFLCNSF
jgi:hypothetical protein